jgi:acyl CoA:acetate/3-ketoacid CoA transferase beta subunit
MSQIGQSDYTIDELISVCISRQIRDGEMVAQGIATPLVTAGYLLAKRTHAPGVLFCSAIGQGLVQDWAPLGVARIESLWLDRAMLQVGFARAATEVLPTFRPREFFRPAQVDLHGNFNNAAMGSDYKHPRLRLPGTGGIPDVTTFGDRVALYVPRHSPVTFVPKVDFVTGLGHSPARTHGAGPAYLVTDLGQFDYAEGRMRLTSLHAGASLERVRAKTGFEFDIASGWAATPPPSAEEVRLLREEIDPLGVRKLELLAGSARKEALRAILAAESAQENAKTKAEG